MLELFVGDICEALSIEAQSYNSSAVLLNSTNIDNFLNRSNGVAYTSIADINNLESFFQLCQRVDKIYYRPPLTWSHSEHCLATETVLSWISQHKSIDGFEHLLKKNQRFGKTFLQADRKTDLPQLWTAGCSITFGLGVAADQNYREIVSKQLNLECSNLSRPSSSIIWQSDQICRSDIRSDDVVFWGLTNINRIPVFKDTEVEHINPGTYKVRPHLIKEFPPELLDNDTLLYHTVLAVRRAYHFCQKVGAKLVILGLMRDLEDLYLHYNVPVFRYLKPTHQDYVDRGTDKLHPGPEQHKIFAKEFLSFYNQLYK